MRGLIPGSMSALDWWQLRNLNEALIKLQLTLIADEESMETQTKRSHRSGTMGSRKEQTRGDRTMRRMHMLGMVLLGFSSLGFSQGDARLSLMPLPRQVTMGSGEFAVGPGFKIEVQSDPTDQSMREAAEQYGQSIARRAGSAVPVKFTGAGTAASAGVMRVVVHASAAMRIGVDESYTLTVTKEGARLEAATGVGALRGFATLRQLVQQDGKRVFLPVVTISDTPRYPWRGLMIDVARHFIPMEVLKRNIDAMELVKLNVLHLHLSDNEGFRVESHLFPKLQGEGSNGEFYTQDQIRELIRYASMRGILIVPEFDMPSHAKSWFAGYPELSSSPGPFKPGPLTPEGLSPKASINEVLAVMQTVKAPAFDPTLETTYTFLDKFIGEMAGLFPSPYIHIGADENNGAVWLANPAIVAFMKEHKLADAPALQAYFVSRVQALVEKHGKQVAAWEEAYVPDQFHNAIFEAWIPFAKSGLLGSPLNNGNKVLVSVGFYLDLGLPAYVHYLNEAVPATANAEAETSLLGGEAAMWTELADGSNLEARIWPRAGAVAERLWSPAGGLDVPEMYRRLFRLSAELDREGVHNLADYNEQVKRLAGRLPVEPVKTLLDVLTPLKGYKRHMLAGYIRATTGRDVVPFDHVADVVLVDSEAKREFRAALASWLKTHDATSEVALRGWLTLWAKNDAALAPYMAQADGLKEVAGHAQQLAAVAAAGLKALDQRDKGEALSAGQLAEADALLKAADTNDGETEIAVLPELEALFHGSLAPEPSSYPLF